MRAESMKFHDVAMAFIYNSICSFTHIILEVKSFRGLDDLVIENFAIIAQNTHEIQIICPFIVVSLDNPSSTMIDDYKNDQGAREKDKPQERENEDNYGSSSNASIAFLTPDRIAFR
ncbi:hypothetical protein EUGRSUZ_K02584 [Eucalyptus grandis]|uniref:Uncharacterized protein n=2 Tax=Eucalyptus grandis TaxID=71139 RepID=A0ACC3IVG7_EUCGR|nr:hypothetical protein EUGRSUZ_K02584 [Eucalyptus grandis]